MGWKAFQDLCGVVLREVFGQTFQTFADSNDGGRDGAFYGVWMSGGSDRSISPGPFVLQAKFFASESSTLTLSSLADELVKIDAMVRDGLCSTYVLMSNARVTGRSERAIRKAILARGVSSVQVFGSSWINREIAGSCKLRMYVPRVYGLGDLSQILDERAYAQTEVLLNYLDSDLATFVITESYKQAAKAIEEAGFVLLLGEPAVGKSVIAATLAMAAADAWGCRTLKVDSAKEIVDHWNSNEKQLFWADDAFGVVRHEAHRSEAWAQRMPKIMSAIRAGARVILTSRDYIYREARVLLKEYSYPLLREQLVVVDVANLDKAERDQIVYNHIKLGDQSSEVRRRMKRYLPSAADAVPFRPEVARRLGRNVYTANLNISANGLVDFMQRPIKFLGEVFEGLPNDQLCALAVVYGAGDLALPLTAFASLARYVELFDTSVGHVAASLEHLEGTFLRLGRKVDDDEAGDYWSFRHPSLREGFARYISSHSHLLEIVVSGMSDTEIISELDCGGSIQRGELVKVPRALWPVIIERLATVGSRPTSSREWLRYGRADDRRMTFLLSRAAKGFVRLYLERDPGLPSRVAGSLMSSVVGAQEPRFLAMLNRYEWLQECDRQIFLEQLRFVALEIPDADWLDIDEVREIVNPEEYAALLHDVRSKLLGGMDDILSDWSLNEQGDSIADYYGPLDDALKRYARSFSADSAVQLAVLGARTSIETTIAESGDNEESAVRTSISLQGLRTMPDVPMANSKGRSIFDDVDT